MTLLLIRRKGTSKSRSPFDMTIAAEIDSYLWRRNIVYKHIFPGADNIIREFVTYLWMLTPVQKSSHFADDVFKHYSDVLMSTIVSQITGISSVYSTVCSDADHREHQSSESLVFVRVIHQWPVNYANPVYGVATICHQVRWLRWGHPSLFHTATSLFIWYKMFRMRDISYKLTWMKFINMLSVYAQSETHRRFNWCIIAILT